MMKSLWVFALFSGLPVLAQSAAPQPAASPPAASQSAASQPAASQSAPPKSAADEAGDVSEVDKDRLGPLRDRVQPVSGHLFRKKGRFELSPSGALSLKDPFFTKYMLGATLTYHPWETFGIGLHFNYAFDSVSGAAQVCNRDAATGPVGCRSATMAELDGKAPGQINLIAGLEGQWAPLYGKLSLFSESFVHFDMYVLAGVAMVRFAGPAPSGIGSSAQTSVGGNAGFGFRLFMNRWLTLRTEIRDLVYQEKVLPLPATQLRQQIVFELGFSMFFPTIFTDS
jgi:outer membrane beta-barrel protein